MYTEKQQWALEQYDALAAKLGSQAKACSALGIGQAVMSMLKRGAYKGNADAQLEKLISYFELKEEAASAPAAQAKIGAYVPTSISINVQEVIRNCHLQGGLAVACGDAGIGKTKAARQYVAEHPSDAIYLALNPCLTQLKSLLKLLCGELNVVVTRTIDEMWLGIASRLRDGMVLIIDEAQHLPPKTLEALRAFSDYFSEKGQTLGVAFIGNSETITNFGGKKRAEFAQIANRTRQRKIYTTNHIRRGDVALLLPTMADKEKEIDFLLGIARGSQAIRGMVSLYTNALDNGDTSYEGLVAMAKHMELQI